MHDSALQLNHATAIRRPKLPARTIQLISTAGSGNGRALATAKALREGLSARGLAARLENFSDLETLRTWAERDRTSFSLLVCVGGDGTVDTAAPAAIRRGVPLLPVPSGFGDLFARALGHGREIDSVIDLIEGRGEVVQVDAETRDGIVSLCHESYGFLSDIQETTEALGTESRQRWLRFLAYYRTALRRVTLEPLASWRVRVDSRTIADDAIIATIANVPTYGPWLKLTPDASPIDGLLDVFVLRRTSKPAMLARLLRWHFGLSREDDGVLLRRGRQVRVSGPERSDVVEVRPGALPVLVSPAMARSLAAEARRDRAAGIGERDVA